MVATHSFQPQIQGQHPERVAELAAGCHCPAKPAGLPLDQHPERVAEPVGLVTQLFRVGVVALDQHL